MNIKNLILILLVLGLQISCSYKDEKKSESPEESFAHDIKKSVFDYLNSSKIGFDHKTWVSTTLSDGKTWIWGACNEEQFKELIKLLDLSRDNNIYLRWAGARDGPPGSSSWESISKDRQDEYFREDEKYGLLIFATYKDGIFFIKISSN